MVGNPGGDQTGDDLMQAAAAPERHYGLIIKLAFMTRSRLQATYQSERDKGAEPLLGPSLPLAPWQKDFKMEWNPCLLGQMNVPRPRGVKGGINCEIICIWESCISISCAHEVL